MKFKNIVDKGLEAVEKAYVAGTNAASVVLGLDCLRNLANGHYTTAAFEALAVAWIQADLTGIRFNNNMTDRLNRMADDMRNYREGFMDGMQITPVSISATPNGQLYELGEIVGNPLEYRSKQKIYDP